jgi:DNA polymerase-3 subunit delta
MPLSFGQWQKALAADRLAPVYLLAGEELLVLEGADALRVQAKKLGYSEREVIDVTQHFDWDDLARSAAGMSLFATRRLIDLRLPTGRPGIEGAKAINAFCADPPPDVTLLITAMEWSSKHDGAWSKKLDASGMMVVFNAPRPNEWAAWLGTRLASRGLSATPDAIALLAGRVEGNLLAAAQEIDKLAILHRQGRIDATEMENLQAHRCRLRRRRRARAAHPRRAAFRRRRAARADGLAGQSTAAGTAPRQRT